MIKRPKLLFIVIVVIIITVILMGIYAFFMTRGEDNVGKGKNKFITEANDNSEVIKEKTISGLKISNVVLIVKEKGSTFTADVTNTTEKEITGKLNIIFKTSSNKEVISILGYFGDSIKAGETKHISSNTSRRLTKKIIKSVDYELNE